MQCPFCRKQSRTHVVDSRTIKDGRSIRRRRECVRCAQRFTTYEEVEIVRLIIIKRDGIKEEYNRSKIEDGLRHALQKRPVSEERLQKTLTAIEYDLQSREKKELKSRVVGKIVMQHLRELDEVAFIRFASVYKAIGSADSFRKVINEMMREDD